MIDVLGPVPAAAHGGCVECDPNDDRGYDDDLYVFVLGSSKIRLCRQHLAMLQTGIARAVKLDDEHRKANRPDYLAIVEQAERDRENSGN